jgi:hypothetical protein
VRTHDQIMALCHCCLQQAGHDIFVKGNKVYCAGRPEGIKLKTWHPPDIGSVLFMASLWAPILHYHVCQYIRRQVNTCLFFIHHCIVELILTAVIFSVVGSQLRNLYFSVILGPVLNPVLQRDRPDSGSVSESRFRAKPGMTFRKKSTAYIKKPADVTLQALCSPKS